MVDRKILENKREAFSIIDKMYSEGKSKERIILKLQTQFGFGAHFVNSRIKLIDAVINEESVNNTEKRGEN